MRFAAGYKYLIYSPPYSEKVGGIIFLHHLCHLINLNGGEAYLYPAFVNHEISQLNLIKPIFKTIHRAVLNYIRPYKTNNNFLSPVITERLDVDDNWIVVYPEIVFGNPLQARNVVRWFLHKPGFHTGKIYYSPGELYFNVHSGFGDFQFPGSVTSKHLLSLRYFPLEIYNETGSSASRAGCAYLIKKGRNRPDLPKAFDGDLIDGLSHAEIASIFKRVRTFVSYDLYSAYSKLAVLCGCDSVVMPQPEISEDMWFQNPKDRNGIAYGFKDIERARKTKIHLIDDIHAQNKKNNESVLKFIDECENFFSK